MTITVTFEEVQAYEKALFDWNKKWLEHAATILPSRVEMYQAIELSSFRTPTGKFWNDMTEWGKKNPQPSFLPKDLA